MYTAALTIWLTMSPFSLPAYCRTVVFSGGRGNVGHTCERSGQRAIASDNAGRHTSSRSPVHITVPFTGLFRIARMLQRKRVSTTQGRHRRKLTCPQSGPRSRVLADLH